ncbi:MAG: lipoate--protein ligase family protein [Methanomassiliicoccales archaeon]|nr:lipoate--protein ligase family protein [Methanomassiliicoccales archaeon]
MIWRLVRFEYHDAATNMALDEAVSNGIVSSTSPPTIRFYGWTPSAVSIGRFQSLGDEVDLQRCRELGVDVVRRRTGGGAVYHDIVGEVTYSLIAPEGMMPQDINAAYQEICGHIVSALSFLGVEAQFAPINDILVAGKKISGSAQSRRNSVFLQHGTLLLDLDLERMFSVLKVSDAKNIGRNIASARERVTSLREHSSASKEEVLAALERAFTFGKEWKLGYWSGAELAEAERLVSTRYAQSEWNGER